MVEEEFVFQKKRGGRKGSRMIENDDGILHEEGFVGEFCGFVPVCGDGEAGWYAVLGLRAGVVSHLGAVWAHGGVCVDIWL